MNESRLRTIAQINAFLDGASDVEFAATAVDDSQRYEPISGVLKRFD